MKQYKSIEYIMHIYLYTCLKRLTKVRHITIENLVFVTIGWSESTGPGGGRNSQSEEKPLKKVKYNRIATCQNVYTKQIRACQEAYFNIQDENENFVFSISGFETRTWNKIETILRRIFENATFNLFLDRYFQKENVNFSIFPREFLRTRILVLLCPEEGRGGLWKLGFVF